MRYTIRHVTHFRYWQPVSESITEVRMQPRTTPAQVCRRFDLHVRPEAATYSYEDYLGNVVHHFTQPQLHQELAIVAESEVELVALPVMPDTLPASAWDRIDALAAQSDHWEMLAPSGATEPTPLLAALARELNAARRGDPLCLLRELNAALHRHFAYDSGSTRVDSPIDEALTHRRGVCQDFTHVMLALVRSYLRIPCRYVSGYLYHRRADRSADGASHAWLEVLLPDLGWVGFDPTNNVLAGERHIQTAVGRDYHDVPPTRGVFKGGGGSDLSVTVRVRAAHDLEYEEPGPAGEHPVDPPYRSSAQAKPSAAQHLAAMQMMQQQ
jgi:transglutaminase-like putative cysteine protease